MLDISMPRVFRPLPRLVTSRFDRENLRTVASLEEYAEADLSERSRVHHDPAPQS